MAANEGQRREKIRKGTHSMPSACGKPRLAPFEPVWSQPWTAAESEQTATVKSAEEAGKSASALSLRSSTAQDKLTEGKRLLPLVRRLAPEVVLVVLG